MSTSVREMTTGVREVWAHIRILSESVRKVLAGVRKNIKSLLRRLQAQTLPNATLGKLPLFTKIAVTFKPMKQFKCPLNC